PDTLFNGRDLTGWTTQGPGPSNWTVRNGVLTNTAGGGANLMTTRTFNDFKLHIEFRYPPQGNSGVYLRGRYEVQVEDNREPDPLPVHIGGVYGMLWPNENASTGPNTWQTYDITLVGRRLTVVLNGKTVIDDQIIPGPTGGAIDSNEGAPGPILLQGDHTAVDYRNIVLTPARSP
ncbi:MAG: 3-keto-disaccharide hydrolase, partial [Gemmatimonadaceae bacterium]